MIEQKQQHGVGDFQSVRLAESRGCEFVCRTFTSSPSVQSRDPAPWDMADSYYAVFPFVGQEFDPNDFEIVEDGWDHERCQVCNRRIEPGDQYWQCTEVTDDGAELDWELCVECYEQL